jgi:hypothetical protein
MADETPICKKCGASKKMLKGKKRNQFFIGCPNCSPHAGQQPSTELGRTTSPPAPEVKPPKKPEAAETKKKTFWW